MTALYWIIVYDGTHTTGKSLSTQPISGSWTLAITASPWSCWPSTSFSTLFPSIPGTSCPFWCSSYSTCSPTSVQFFPLRVHSRNRAHLLGHRLEIGVQLRLGVRVSFCDGGLPLPVPAHLVQMQEAQTRGHLGEGEQMILYRLSLSSTNEHLFMI